MRLKIGPVDFTQPSTWRGIVGIAAVCWLHISPELSEQIAVGIGAALSAIELFRNEYATKNPPKAETIPSELKEFADTAYQLRHSNRIAADVDRRLRQPVPTEPKTARNPESPGFGDR